MHFEVEQKYCVESHDALRARLKELGAQPMPSVSQHDTYYGHPQRDFATTDEALRIRRVGDGACVTYKGPKIDASTKTRKEIEIFLAEGAGDAEQLDAMLLALGFHQVAVVSKQRQAYRLERETEQVEVALDELEGLGCFAELEISATTEEAVEVARQIIARLADELGLTEVQRLSYLELLLDSREP